jgi:hypothetical protein
MALFNLTDMSFSSAKKATGPLAVLTTSKYATNTYRYPIDLGSSDKGHYMVININEQKLTSFPGNASGDSPTAIANSQKNGSFNAGTTNITGSFGELTQTVNNSEFAQSVFGGVSSVYNTVTNILPSSGAAGSAIQSGAAGMKGFVEGGYSSVIEGAKNLATGSVRAERRITDTVALYMPDTLAFTTNQNYENVSAGGQLLTAAAALGSSAVDTLKNQSLSPEQMGKELGKNLSPFIANMIAKSAGGLGLIAFQQATGLVQNPMMEVLYTSPDFRSFRFDFQFYPRSEQEASAVQNIISRLRFHQAPEVAKGGTNGFFLIPPSEFDISFYYNGKVNPNIPPISTCVLTSMDVDYAPGGFSAYEVPGEGAMMGRTGMPVSIRLSLQFKETEIMTKTSYDRIDNYSTANRYKTNAGSQQSQMLADQDRDFF